MLKKLPPWLIHSGLFCLTVLTTMMVGAELRANRSFFVPEEEGGLSFSNLSLGLSYCFAFLLFLTTHEFGHYFTARYNKVKASLPFYIPIYIPGVLNIGSLGAVIRLRETPRTTAQYFDIGIAGPLAGFVVAVGILIYGFQTLPPMEEYVLPINGDYVEIFGRVPAEAELQSWIEKGGFFERLSLTEKAELLEEEERILPLAVQDSIARSRFIVPTYKVGNNLLFELLKRTAAQPDRIPSHFDLIHYPWLFVGYLALFFTALNLLPIGQLDGGHVMYGLLGRQRAARLATAVVVLLSLVGGLGLFRYENFLDWSGWLVAGLYGAYLTYVVYRLLKRKSFKKVLPIVALLILIQIGLGFLFPKAQPSPIWLLYGFLAVRFIGVEHPPAWREHPLSTGRKVLGWIAVLIFILCFSFYPVEVVG
ncbi:MAG: site-2 protease family protein [Bacteroidia bacterium]